MQLLIKQTAFQTSQTRDIWCNLLKVDGDYLIVQAVGAPKTITAARAEDVAGVKLEPEVSNRFGPRLLFTGIGIEYQEKQA